MKYNQFASKVQYRMTLEGKRVTAYVIKHNGGWYALQNSTGYTQSASAVPTYKFMGYKFSFYLGYAPTVDMYKATLCPETKIPKPKKLFGWDVSYRKDGTVVFGCGAVRVDKPTIELLLTHLTDRRINLLMQKLKKYRVNEKMLKQSIPAIQALITDKKTKS